MRRPRYALSPLCLWALGLLSLCAAFAAPAQTRAWIDRDRVAVGETATLNIETDAASADAPDYSPLQHDFEISGNTSSRQIEIVNGRTSARMLFAVALQPRRDGILIIPALRIGAQATKPLTLTVTAARPARVGGPVFIEAEADDQSPYVQQSVGYTVKLFYDMPLISGQLDQAPPDGASLQRIGSDLQYTSMVDGKRYTVVERRFLLVPERSGALTVPAARFQGRGAGGFFDDVFGDGQRSLNASGAPRVLGVRAAPANAPQPWLPLRGLTLRYLAAPQRARSGEAATVTVELRADGATAAQLPDLQLAAIDGAQVFADPPQSDDVFEDGRPQVRLTRKFSIVPTRAGALRVPGPRMAWWDTRAATARTASLPDLNLSVAAGARGAASPLPDATAAITGQDASDAGVRIPGISGPVEPWALATIAFALLWLVTLGWALFGRAPPRAPLPAQRGRAPAPSAAPARIGLRELRQALDTGTLGDVATVLCAMAAPRAADLDAVHARLDDDAQRQAVEQLQRARWGDGDGPATRARLRDAFAASGPRWRQPGQGHARSVLPPLYPT